MKNIIKIPKAQIILLTLTCIISFQATAKIYTWIDNNGQTHYSATPPKNSNTSKEISVKNSSITIENNVPPKQTLSKEKTELPPLKEQVKNLHVFTKLQCLKAIQSIPDLTKAMGTKRPKEAQKIKNVLDNINLTVILKDIPSCSSNYQRNAKHKIFINCIADNNSYDALTCISSIDVANKQTIPTTKAKKQCYIAIKIDREIILNTHNILKEKLKKEEISEQEYKSQRSPLTSQLKLIESLSLSSCIDNYNNHPKDREFINCYANSYGIGSCLKKSIDPSEFGATPKTLIEVSKLY